MKEQGEGQYASRMLLFWVNLSQGHKRIYSKNKRTCEHLAQTIIIYKKIQNKYAYEGEILQRKHSSGSRTGELVNTIHCNFSNYRKEKNRAHPFSKHPVYYQKDETFITNRK